MTILLDFESVSRSLLTDVGGRNYWAHPTTEALCVCWERPETGESGVWFPGDPTFIAPGETWAAHNATGFDRHGVARYGLAPGQDPLAYVDTSEIARTVGLPGALDALGTRLFGVAKDAEGSKFTRGLSSVRKPRAMHRDEWAALDDEDRALLGDQPEITGAALERVVQYCQSDVRIMGLAWDMLSPFAALEPDVVRLDREVNDRGVHFDRDLAKALIACSEINQEAVLEEVAGVMGWTPAEVRAAANSPKQFCAATGLPNAQAETVQGSKHPLARARMAIASIARGKLEAGLRFCSPDGVMRDALRYYGGHTGRWAGKGMQLHNLPRPHKRYEDWAAEEICALADRVRDCKHLASQDEIDLLVRATLWAGEGKTLVVRDFSGVEARALALLANDEKALDVFRSGRDPYKVAASTIFRVPYESVDKPQRQLGKTSELACGYGQGAKKFEETAAKMGANLRALGVSARDVVNSWRRLHAPIVRFWYETEAAFTAALGGRVVRMPCGITFAPIGGGAIGAILPSGRPVVYQGARMSSDGRGLVYIGTKGEEHIYGGKIVENIVQAYCRDKLVHSMRLADRAGLPIVLTVHDEIVCAVDRAALVDAGETLQMCCTDTPEWAPGFPEAAAGFESERYRK